MRPKKFNHIRPQQQAIAWPLLCMLLCILFCTTLYHGCSVKKEQIPQLSDTITSPYQSINTSTLYCYSGQRLLWKLKSNYLKKLLSDTSSLLAVPVRMTIFDTVKTKTTTILSDSGTTTKEMEKFFLWGNVYIKNWDGLVIQSQSLWWNKSTHRFGSEEFVEIKTPTGDVLRGKGLDATETFSWWSLRKSVSGEFPNFKKRLELDTVVASDSSDSSDFTDTVTTVTAPDSLDSPDTTAIPDLTDSIDAPNRD